MFILVNVPQRDDTNLFSIFIIYLS